MKKTLFLISFVVVSIGIISIACTKSSAESDRTSFSVSESDDSFDIAAAYNKSKIEKVQSALNEGLKPTIIFQSAKDNFSKTITLGDKTQFTVKTSPGKVAIEFDKTKNSRRGLRS